MNKELLTDFIGRLIVRTLDHSISWTQLSTPSKEYSNVISACHESDINFNTEFHYVIIDESFFILCNQGYIFLLSEVFDSPIVGESKIYIKLYIQKDTNSPIHEIATSKVNENLHRLLNAIKSTIIKSDTNADIEKFIQDFLNDQQNP